MNDRIRQQLLTLPDAEPSDALWWRIAQARQTQIRHRRRWIAGGATAGVVVALTLLLGLPPRPAHDRTAPAIATTPSNQPSSNSVAMPPDALRRIDRELQLAYARNADDAELASLWAVRQDILHSRPKAVQPMGI